MRRLARVLSLGGGAAVVLALSKVHARYVADPRYDFTGSSRFAWAGAYIVLLMVSAYALGLPDQPRNRRDGWLVGFASALRRAELAARTLECRLFNMMLAFSRRVFICFLKKDSIVHEGIVPITRIFHVESLLDDG